MSDRKELRRILGFDQTQPWPTISWVIAGGNERYEPECCPSCASEVRPRPTLSLEGYDEYAVGETRRRAFWPNDAELLSLAPYIREIAGSLTGAAPIPVVYADWNQTSMPAWRLALKRPRLSAVEIVGRSIGAFHPELGELGRCGACRAVPVDEWVRSDRNELLPFASTWDGTDIFRIAGTYDRFITTIGVEKLAKLGFTNLKLAPALWAEDLGAGPPN